MANYRKKRRRGGIKGCCGMCCLATTDGRRNGRKMTKQERISVLTYEEEIEALDDPLSPKSYPRRGSLG